MRSFRYTQWLRVLRGFSKRPGSPATSKASPRSGLRHAVTKILTFPKLHKCRKISRIPSRRSVLCSDFVTACRRLPLSDALGVAGEPGRFQKPRSVVSPQDSPRPPVPPDCARAARRRAVGLARARRRWRSRGSGWMAAVPRREVCWCRLRQAAAFHAATAPKFVTFLTLARGHPAAFQNNVIWAQLKRAGDRPERAIVSL